MTTMKAPALWRRTGLQKLTGLVGTSFWKLIANKHFRKRRFAPRSMARTAASRGVSVRRYAPVFDLCRGLVAAGFAPACPLEAWRGETLCLRVRSISEGAQLTVADDRHGTPRLRRQQGCPQRYAAGSPVRQTGGAATAAPTHKIISGSGRWRLAPCRPAPDQSPFADRHLDRHRPVRINRMERQCALAAVFQASND